MSKTIIAVRHFGLGGRESLETAVINKSSNAFVVSLLILATLVLVFIFRTVCLLNIKSFHLCLNIFFRNRFFRMCHEPVKFSYIGWMKFFMVNQS